MVLYIFSRMIATEVEQCYILVVPSEKIISSTSCSAKIYNYMKYFLTNDFKHEIFYIYGIIIISSISIIVIIINSSSSSSSSKTSSRSSSITTIHSFMICLFLLSCSLFVTSLVKALDALFSLSEGRPVAVLRFWGPLLVNLISNLDYKVFPALSSLYQVCNTVLP